MADETPNNYTNKLNPAIEADQTAWIYEKKLLGYSLRQIAAAYKDEFGRSIAPNTVRARILSHIQDGLEPLAEEVRTEEISRYDMYLKALEPKILAGDDKAINTAIRVSEARRKLLGVDVPVVQQVAVLNVDPSTLTLGELIAQKEAENAALTQAPAQISSMPEQSRTEPTESDLSGAWEEVELEDE